MEQPDSLQKSPSAINDEDAWLGTPERKCTIAPMSIEPQNLIESARLFGREAVEQHLLPNPRYDWRFVTVFASTAFEYLCKAALVQQNALLISEGDEASVLSFADLQPSPRARSISATKALARCCALIPALSKSQARLVNLIEIRNGVVHLGPVRPDEFESLFDNFLSGSQVLLSALGEDPHNFWDHLHSVVQERVGQRAATLDDVVRRKVSVAEATFQARVRGLSEHERVALMSVLGASPTPWTLVGGEQLNVTVPCPACFSAASVFGSLHVNWEIDDGEWRGFTRLSPSILICRICGLELEDEEILIAGIDPDVPDELDAGDFSDPPDYEDLPGYGLVDVHPRMPPN